MARMLQFFVVVCMLLALIAKAEVTIQLVEPIDGSVLEPCSNVLLKAEVTATAGDTIKDVRFYYNDRQRYRDRRAPYEYNWKRINRGVYVLTAKATTTAGVEFWSDPVRIKVGQVSNGEKLFNGGFDCGKATFWSMFSHSPAEATFEILDDNYFDDPYYLMVDITNGGSEMWHVQASIACPTDSGHVYEISFLADADDPKTIDIAMQENQDPWAVQFIQSVDIDGPDLYGPFEFVAVKTDPTNYLRFNVGANNIPFYLDDVSVIDRSMAGVKAKRFDGSRGLTTEYELQQAYPNPFNMSTSIRYRLARDARVTLDIINMQGRRVRTLVNGSVAAGQHVAQWNGMNDLGFETPSGVYLYRMSAASVDGGNVVLSRKILLIK